MKVLVADPIHDEGVKLLKEFAEVEVALGLSQSELLERVKGCKVLVVRSATQVTREVIDAGESLRVIARAGVGLDNIDVEAARAKGIKLVNAPEAPTIAVAELVFGFMLAWSRRLVEAHLSTSRGEWRKRELLGSELRGKTLGIVGTGRVGQAVGFRAKAFEMRLLAFDVTKKKEFIERAGAKYVELDQLLRESDFVTLHVPLTPQTRHLIGERELGLMKPTAVLINTSRGGVVDEEALVKALREGKIAGACLDVYEREPPVGSPLLSLPNVLLTPHLGASTQEAQRAAAVLIAKRIKEALEVA